MDLRDVDSKTLLQKTRALVKNEREITLSVLHHLREIERRSLFAELGFPSLFEYTVKDLGYSAGAAHRRISSMRLLKSLPELEKKIESGALSLTTLSKAQSFFRTEMPDKTQKLEILKSLEGKIGFEVEKELAARAKHPEKLVAEKLRPVAENLSKVTFFVEDALLARIEEIRNSLAHSHPNMTIKEVFEYALGEVAKKIKPKEPKEKLPAPPLSSTAEVKKAPRSRYVSVEVKRRVWKRDGGTCTYKDSVSGRKCCSKYGLELDHIKPFSLGGSSDTENLRLRCRAHNQLAAIQSFGEKKMQSYVSRIR